MYAWWGAGTVSSWAGCPVVILYVHVLCHGLILGSHSNHFFNLKNSSSLHLRYMIQVLVYPLPHLELVRGPRLLMFTLDDLPLLSSPSNLLRGRSPLPLATLALF